MILALRRLVSKRRKLTEMGYIGAVISTYTAKSARLVTIWITPKPFGIRTYERGFKSMKTLIFNPCICHTYDDRACNPCISNTYEKHGGWGCSARIERAGHQSAIRCGSVALERSNARIERAARWSAIRCSSTAHRSGNLKVAPTKPTPPMTRSKMPVTAKHPSTHANRQERPSVLTFSGYVSSLWRSMPGRLSAATDTHGNFLGTALPNEVVLQTGCRSYRHRIFHSAFHYSRLRISALPDSFAHAHAN